MTTTRPLSRGAITRITLDILAAELSRSRGRSAAALGRAAWSDALCVEDGGLDLDSLERLGVSAALSEFFHLHEHGAEDHLLMLPGIGDWCDLIEQSLAATGTHLTFRTSGSTGEAKRCTHSIADLKAEAEGWARYLGNVAGIVALVPAHHIYGAIFAALLPDILGADCSVDDAAGAAAVRRAPSGTLVVGTPTHWTYLAQALADFPAGLVGVTSTAPMPPQLASQLREQRLATLVEVYGSSETGGVAVRRHETAAFELLEGWSAGVDDSVERTLGDGSRMLLDTPDHLRWIDDRRFVLEGRRDGAVQVGGINVFPARVRDTLLACSGVADAAVRLDPQTGRLKAFVVPSGVGAEPDTLAGELDRWCGTRLTDVERPRRFAVGSALPRNAMGKLADW